MKPLRIIAFAVLAATWAASLSSCAITNSLAGRQAPKAARGQPLQPGTKYEVRKALAAGVPFRPESLSRYHFVFEPPKPPLQAAGMNPQELAMSGQRMTVRTTAYCHDESDHIEYGVRNALGTKLKYGALRSAAADWSRYPVGTLFRISGQPNVVYEVDDYGSALVGTGTIDLYRPSRGLMNEWGVRHVDIEVIRWGSYQRSMEVIRDRSKWPHVRKMIEGIQTQLYQASLPTSKKRGSLTAAL